MGTYDLASAVDRVEAVGSRVRQFKYSKLVLRVHGSVAIFLGVTLTVMGWVGTHYRAGQMAMLQQNPLIRE